MKAQSRKQSAPEAVASDIPPAANPEQARAAGAGKAAVAAKVASPARTAPGKPAPAKGVPARATPPGLAETQAMAPLPPDFDLIEEDEDEDDAPPPPPKPVRVVKPEEFRAGDHVVYPTHGVGTVQGIETMQAAGLSLKVIVVTFEENRMTLRVPINKAASSGLRKLATTEGIEEALQTLRGRARIKRTMWSRRAQEYEAKINSGDPVAIAEVVRDLHRNAGQPDQSFSERQIYEQALDRLAAEVAAIDRTDKAAASDKIQAYMKGA
ncbi:CarD family transcriptional regulator [Roseomonas sp. NAR14]|uniref:CarD family transcriptional regulator n=1 Tax=Roseomonas acroporae TaxID=2937791 RepID=A0A9X1Y6J5_9PROT|nr:CarD family transcriptional regulator [Roseomonas acroporae]MCK8784013.1 CarD family transcriptional regulator [Roseomonas acroporae]